MLNVYKLCSLSLSHSVPTRLRTRLSTLIASFTFVAIGTIVAAPVHAGTHVVGVSTAEKSILVLGDSLSAGYGIQPTQGWVFLLSKALASQGYDYEVTNASVSGETTGGGSNRVAHLLALHHPQIVIIELGANDGLRGLPLSEIESNLLLIVARCQEQKSQPLLIGMRLPQNYGPEYTTRFAEIFPKVARASHVPLVAFLLEKVASDMSTFQADGLHPIASVQSKLLDTVWPSLVPLLRKASNK